MLNSSDIAIPKLKLTAFGIDYNLQVLYQDESLQYYHFSQPIYPAGIDSTVMYLKNSDDIARPFDVNYSCKIIPDQLLPVQFPFDTKDRLNFYVVRFGDVELSRDSTTFPVPKSISVKVEPPYENVFSAQFSVGAFNGYSYAQIMRNLTDVRDLIDPEVSLSIIMNGKAQPLGTFKLQTVDDTHVYNTTIYPLGDKFVYPYMGPPPLAFTTIIKIKEPKNRVTRFRTSGSVFIPTSDDEEYFIKVGLKDGVTTILYSSPISQTNTPYTLSHTAYKIERTTTYLTKKTLTYTPTAVFNDKAGSVEVIGGGLMFNFNFQSSRQDYYFGDQYNPVNVPYPFGIINRVEGSVYNIQTSHFIPQNIDLYSFSSVISPSSVPPVSPPPADSKPPAMVSIEVIKVDYITNVYRFHITDVSGLLHIKLGFTFYAKDYIVSGSPQDGIYEIPIDIALTSQNYIMYTVTDWKLNLYSLSPSQNPNYNVNSKVPRGIIINYRLEDISYFQFKYNTMDTSQSDAINYLFLNLTCEFDKEWTPQLYISRKPVLSDTVPFTGYWDDNLKIFIIPFFIEKNFPNTILYYHLLSSVPIPQFSLYPIFGENTTVTVVTDKSDYLAPVISKIEVQEPFSIQGSTNIRLGWMVTIEDEIMGFSNGYFEVKTNLDWYTFKLYLNDSNRVSGDKNLGVYNVNFIVDQAKCVPLNYTISKVVLDQFDSSEIIFRDPYMKCGVLPDIAAPCTVSSYPLDTLQPTLISFSGAPSYVDVKSNQRSFTISFSTNDSESGISENNLPMVYIQSMISKPIGFQSSLKDKTGSNFNYQCQIEIPYDYGFGSNISLSIYGIVDNALNMLGYSSHNLSLKFPDQKIFIERRAILSNSGVYLKKHSSITKRGGLLKIEGSGLFNDSLSYELDFGNGPVISGTDFTVISPSIVAIRIQPFKVNEFTVIIKKQGIPSNTLKVVPDIHDYEAQTHIPGIPLTPSPTPTPTVAPIPCPGDCYQNASSSDSICSNRSKLSKAKIAAIVVCGTVFLAAFSIGAIILIKKRIRVQRQMKNLNLKMSSVNQ
eukprot:gene895-1120_t